MRRCLLVALGSAMGAALRYFLGLVALERFWPRFPVATLSVNLRACFLIGFIIEYLDHHAGANEAWRYVFAIGFVGA